MYAWLQDAIDKDAEIVTASRRLARELSACFSQSQIAAGKSAWLTPSISAWPDWLASKLDNARSPSAVATRIDAFSSSVAWERCLKRQVPDSVLNVAGIARQSFPALQLVADWSVPREALLTSAMSEDERQFARAAADYWQTLDAAGWIDRSAMSKLATTLIREQAVTIPAAMVLVGFDRLIPSVSELITTIEAAGCDLTIASSPAIDAEPLIAEFEDFDAEMRSAGAWARDWLANDPQAKLAIVNPALDNSAEKTRRMILEGLAPGWQNADKGYRDSVNVSFGRPLSAFPAIQVVVLILKWLTSGLTSREISVLLRSKCICGNDVAGRSRLEFALRSFPDRQWKVSAFRDALRGRIRSADVDQFFTALDKMHDLAEEGASRKGPSDWAGRIDNMLKQIRWPGEQALDSEEFQLVNRWRKLLNEFARSEIVVAEMNLPEAVSRLTALAGDTLYQAEAAAGSVQVLGALEVAGMQFDGIWISGMDAAQWPPTAGPSPFLSRALQKKHGMPDATPADSLQFARRTLDRMIASASRCVVSWARYRDDADLTISPLLDGMKMETYNGPADPGWFAWGSVQSEATELVFVDKVPPVSVGERIRGGAFTVQRQYQEPFAAFVHGRLGVRHADAIEPGLSARSRGNMIHDALHNLLASKPSLADIRQWSEAERLRRTGSAIDAALADFVAFADPVIRQILSLERQRLISLLDELIDLEVDRADFQVSEVESEVLYSRGVVNLALRVDRIDQLVDGSLLIIDYKTGVAKNFLNKDGEPLDLQLIVYADALPQQTGGLSLINIDSRLINYKGAGGSISWDPDGGEQWNERLAAWKALVHKAVDEFAAGDVRINLQLNSAQARPLQILSRQEEIKRAD